MKKTSIGLLALVQAASMLAFADEWFVDDARPSGTGDGRRAETAFHTIQEAVDRASDGDTVTVLPGVYDEGGHVDSNGYTNRVAVLGKRLTIRARDGKAVTHVVGAFDPAGVDLDGKRYPQIGPAAVRCFLVKAAAGTRIEGFTIRGGASHECPRANLPAGLAGGVSVLESRNDVYVADCTVRDCVASRGGGLCGGTAIRCVLEGNRTHYGTGLCARDANLYNCLVSRNARDAVGNVVLWNCRAVNCTIAENPAGAAFAGGELVNSLLFLNGGGGLESQKTRARNCLLSHDDANCFTADSVNVLSTSDRQFVAPATGDFRPLEGSLASAYAAAEDLNAFAVPERDRRLDLSGAQIAESGPIAAGCLQGAVEPQGGGWLFRNQRVVVDGYATEVADTWVYATRPNQVVRVRMDGSEGEIPFLFSIDSGASFRVPLEDGSEFFMMPPQKTVMAECRPYLSTNVLHVSPAGEGAPGEGDGSRERPFRTIQKAVSAVPTGTSMNTASRTVILVGAGEYTPADGVTEGQGQANVVYVENRFVRIVGEGRGKSVIRGAAAPGSRTDAAPFGCGAGAVRCVGVSGGVVSLERLTLADGRGASYEGTAYGAGVRGSSKTTTFIGDCTITNCIGNRGGAYYGACACRTLVTGCQGYYGGIRAGIARSCVFERNLERKDQGCVGLDSAAYACTFSNGGSPARESYFASGGAVVWNSIAAHGVISYAANDYSGNVFWDFATREGSGFAEVAPQFLGEGQGDLRVLVTSGALGRGTADSAYYRHACADFDGRAPLVLEDGRLTPGAFQSPVSAVIVTRIPDGTLDNVGTNAVEAGESLTVSVASVGRRHLTGLTVDGKPVSAMSYTYVPPPGRVATQPVVVGAAYDPNWYVATDGQDTANGWTPQTARRTLAMGVADAVRGDVVHVAAGSYDEGSGLQARGAEAVEPVIRSRVVIPAGVTLKSDEGPEVTFIVGEKDPGSSAFDGCGNSAKRCVFLEDEACVSGFTICNGRVDGTTLENVNSVGAGVYARTVGLNRLCGVAENCIISNHCGRSGAGSYRGRYVGCRFSDCKAIYGGAIGRYSAMYSCFADNNWGNTTFELYYGVENCTFGANNKKSDGITAHPHVLSEPSGGTVARNSVFLDHVRKETGKAVVATNCVFRNDAAPYYPEEINRPGCMLLSVDEMKLMAGSCVPAADSPLTDAAEAACVDEIVLASADAAGGQRVFNGVADIGAFEHDWRPEYGAMLGVSRVGTASPGVVGSLGDSFVTVGAATLGVTLAGGVAGRKNRLTVPFAVAGSGLLTVTVNGECVGSYAKEDGEKVLQVKSPLAENGIVFEYAGDDEGVRIGRLSQLTPGCVFMLR